ncbi:MAG: DUF892 family protein [Chitinophagales bacterium]
MKNGILHEVESTFLHQMKVILEDSYELRVFFENELNSIYWAEKAILKMLSKLGENSISDKLFVSLEDHLPVKKEQLSRVEEIFNAIALTPEEIKCDAVARLFNEMDRIIATTEVGYLRDSWAISVLQKIAFYEITSYGTLRSFADLSGQTEVADLLNQTLDEEKAYTLELSKIGDVILKDITSEVKVKKTARPARIAKYSDSQLFQPFYRLA